MKITKLTYGPRDYMMLFACFSLIALLTSCSNDDFFYTEGGGEEQLRVLPENALTIVPSIFGGKESSIEGSTRGKDDDDTSIVKDDEVNAVVSLRETYIGTLDVFVKKHSDAASAAWFKTYHLKVGATDPNNNAYAADDTNYLDASSNPTSLLDQARHLLEKDWLKAEYDAEEKYDIYVTANNKHTTDPAYDEEDRITTPPANLAALQALTTYESNIFRYYKDATVGNYDYHQQDLKSFLMDGQLLEWSFDRNTTDQEMDVDLKRAAAKIIVRLRYSDEETAAFYPDYDDPNTPDIDETTIPEMTTPPDSDRPVIKMGSIKEYLQYLGRTPGIPRMKYVNFGFTVADVQGSSYLASSDTGNNLAVQTYGSNFSVYNNEGTDVLDENPYTNTENTYTITTYSYPISWGNDPTKAPSILLSIAYTREHAIQNSSNNTLIAYYRIPVCDENQVTSLERNNIYIVDAEIASLGAENADFELKDEQLRIEYHVIPWTEFNVEQQATTVKVADTKYFTVTPTEYTLKGENVGVDLQYFASVSTDDGRFVDLDMTKANNKYKYFNVSYVNATGNTVNITTPSSNASSDGTVTKEVKNTSGGWTSNAATGTTDIRYTSTAPTSGAQSETVEITITPNGIIHVESQALKSRAVKTIKFRAVLTTAESVFYQDIVIKHFPLDNIQSIAGKWSSRIGTVTITRYYSSDPTATTWTAANNSTITRNWGVDDYDGIEAVISSYGNQETINNRATFTAGIPVGNGNRGNYNSEANAYVNTNDHYIYWGTGSSNNNSYRNDYDWSTGGWWTTYYRYQNYYRRSYSETNMYYKDIKNITENWVDWSTDANQTYSGNARKINGDTHFMAKVFDNNVIKAVVVNQNGDNKTYSLKTTNNTDYYYYWNGSETASVNTTFNATNNHMYVIQITSTSTTYTIGKPVINTLYQSYDHVVSPAFMIASQLGAVISYKDAGAAEDAAAHCGTYMEVGADNEIEAFRGKKFTGWRLPTKEEIDVIIGYQQTSSPASGITMSVVLGGGYYWTLDGTAAPVEGGSGGSETDAYVRCIRDLTLDEINAINGN